MKKAIIPFMVLPFFLFGCGKDKNVYASSKNTIYKFTLDGENAVITGLNDNYKNQKDIIIPYSIDKHVVKKIESHSFEGNYRLENIDMSKSKLEEIGSYSFKKCSGLAKIIYPTTITSIEENAFESCTTLTTMDLSNCTLETISNNLFLNCSSLTNVTFPTSTKVIGSNIFSGCDSITGIDYSYLELEELSDYAFSNLANLKDIKLSSTTKKIGNYAFSDNKKIQFVDLTNTKIEEIGEGAFSNCSILANIVLPQTLNKLGAKSFYYCSKLSKIDLTKTQLEDIPESCFELCRSFDNIKLPSNIKTISSRAFYNSSLRLINISSGVTSIADDAFRLCNKLESIEVDSDNTNFVIHNDALYTYNKEKLIVYPAQSKRTDFAVSPQTKIINPYAFADAVNLVNVNLESVNLSEIGGYTFMNCSSLKTITIGADAATGIKKIGVKAFYGCTSLTSFDGEYSITEIGDSAFYDCSSLKEVYLGESTFLKKIDPEAFYNCNKLETLTLPGSLEVVGRAAFYNCVNVSTFSFGATKRAFLDLCDANPSSGLDQFKDLLA